MSADNKQQENRKVNDHKECFHTQIDNKSYAAQNGEEATEIIVSPKLGINCCVLYDA